MSDMPADSPPINLSTPSFFFNDPLDENQELIGESSAVQDTSFDFPADTAVVGGGTVLSAAKTEKKRRRPALSCEQCRRRKIRCDRSLPCVNCVKSKISPCTYAPTHVPASRARKATNHAVGADSTSHVPARSAAVDLTRKQSLSDTSARQTSSSIPSSTVGSNSGASTVDALAARVKELEQKLAESCYITQPAEGKLWQDEDHQEDEAPMKGTVSKTRFFGQSHWMNGVNMFPGIVDVLKQAESQKAQAYMGASKCKALARTIKKHRLRPVSTDKLGETIPERGLADQLVDAYFDTFEGVLRILHRPTFYAEYERYWQNPKAASQVFVMQLQLCMAMGATVHDDIFSLRSTSMQWVQEVQIWLMLPSEKSRMTIAGVQIMCMMCLAKACCAVGQDLTWISTGSLVRQAMYMGLHREPRLLANMSVYRSEIRRRLWATILELNLQTSYDAGGPPLLSPKHYDTRLPANLNDDQLTDEPDADRQPTSDPETLTDMSVQLALQKSYALRLLIIKHVNEFRSKESYSETLRLNSELTKACRTLTETLAALSQAQRHQPRTIFNQFHSPLVQMFTYRCFLSLHQPMVARSADDPTYYYSRKVSLDSSLKLAQICGLTTPRYGTYPPGGSRDPVTSFNRLITNGAGVFRVVPTQTLFSVALEFVKKSEEQRDSLGGLAPMGNDDLRSVLHAAQVWYERRILAGETNVKGYCFVGACIALADALEMGLSQEETDQSVMDAGAAISIQSYDLLKQAAECQGIVVSESPDAETAPVDMPSLDNDTMQGIMEMPFDWMVMGDLGLDGMGGFNWTRSGMGMSQQFDAVDPSVVSQF
ncbi:fungal-specific transcription factor domain-containing protein [Fusarium avenaceum]|nr:fungal-specific transcription factor domain-containing protein [Fusarium avenaceum]